MRLNQVTVPALDVEASVNFYETLGLTLIVRSPHYARFVLPEGDSTFSIHRADEVARAHAPVVYFECDDLDARVAALKEKGIAFETDPTDQSWLWREASLRDPAGNQIILFRAAENRLYPPWRITPGKENLLFHVVLTEEQLLLVKRPNSDWRALQDEFAGYKTSIGPCVFVDALEIVRTEWPDVFRANEEAIRAFEKGEGETLSL